MPNHYISLNRKEYRKSNKMGIVCTCGESQMTKNNTIEELVGLAKSHHEKTGHLLSVRESPLVN